MASAFQQVFASFHMSTSRQLVFLPQLRGHAEALGSTRLVTKIDIAHAHAWHTRSIEVQASGKKTRQTYPEQVRVMISQLNGILTGIRNQARDHARSVPPGHEDRNLVKQLIADLFPGGVDKLVRASHMNKVTATKVILDKLQGEHAATVERLKLASKVEQLAALYPPCLLAIQSSPAKPAAVPADVKAARAKGHRYLLEIIAIIVGDNEDSSNEVHVARREKLLALLLEHIEEQRKARRAKIARNAAKDQDEDGEDEDGEDENDEDEEEDDIDIDDADSTAAQDAADTQPMPVPPRAA